MGHALFSRYDCRRLATCTLKISRQSAESRCQTFFLPILLVLNIVEHCFSVCTLLSTVALVVKILHGRFRCQKAVLLPVNPCRLTLMQKHQQVKAKLIQCVLSACLHAERLALYQPKVGNKLLWFAD